MIAVISYPPLGPIHVGPIPLSVHGLFIALGIFAGAWLASRRLARAGGDVDKYESVLSWAVVGALLGARYLTAPAALLDGAGWSALSPLSGNFSILGGFTGGILVGLWRLRALGMPVLPTLDVSTYGLALGTVIGRLGCLAIVEHLGRATSLPWGYGLRAGYNVAPAHNSLECTVAQAGVDGLCGVYQPVAAYDLVGAAVLLVALVVWARRVPLRTGQLFALWMAWYGLQRFLLDFLRVGDAAIGPISWNQLSGLVAGLFGIAMFMRLSRNDTAQGGPTLIVPNPERARS
jgi:phosphatidylglycerol:prolipoprotein diacylglycerol transferase